MSYFSTIGFKDNGSLDAFSRLRISQIKTLYDGLNEYNESPLFMENVLTGTGAITHLPNESSVSISTGGTASGAKVVRQSREYFRYIPGKSQYIIMSRIFGATKANVRKRSGYFDDNNGLFFEDNGTNFGLVQRSYTSGSVVDTRIAQTSWNLDKLNGTGASGVTLDLSKDNIFLIDFEWLGAGRVRFGVFIDGKILYLHKFNNENSLTVPYMTTGCLPLRSEIENTSTAASSTDFKITCSSVITEDGASPATGLNESCSNGITPIAVTTRRAILSIRPKATFNSIVNRIHAEEVNFDLLAATNNCFYEIVYGGTLGGTPSWTSAGASSTVEFDVAGTTVTGGIVLAQGYCAVGTKTGSSMSKGLTSKLPLVLDIAGANPINLSIVCTSMSGTSNVAGAFNWLEIY